MISSVTSKNYVPQRLRDKVSQSDLRSYEGGVSNNTLSGANNSPTIIDIYKQEIEFTPSYELGWIWKVVPQKDKVMVVVSTTPNDTSLLPESDIKTGPLMFNHFLKDKEESPEAYRLLPLINYNIQEGISLESLLRAKVRVRIHPSTGIADQAELVFGDSEEPVLKVGITQLDVKQASLLPGDLRDNLIKAGYSEKEVDEYLSLEIKSKEEPLPEEIPKDVVGVYRLDGEGYYDQVVEDRKDTKEKWKPPESWERAKNTMKTKLCHNPIIAFSAK